ncbi:hypothetical protein TNCV_2937481 [Trichonephila clavipes]|nr:hypothetical protein TNCV_2937481 [Trichonephila clavipes]
MSQPKSSCDEGRIPENLMDPEQLSHFHIVRPYCLSLYALSRRDTKITVGATGQLKCIQLGKYDQYVIRLVGSLKMECTDTRDGGRNSRVRDTIP